MSDAFRQQWIRQSASRQLCAILAYLTKQQGEITIPIRDLERIQTGEMIVQAIDGDSLTIRYAPPDTRMFVLNEATVAERSAQCLPQNERRNPTLPSRLETLLDPPLSSPVSTLDDAEMARREAAMTRAAASADQARVMRGQPLPVTQPLHPPS